MNPTQNLNLPCNCKQFLQELKQFSREISKCSNSDQQWEKFETFAEKSRHQFPYLINGPKPCSEKFCKMIRGKKKEIGRSAIKMTTMLANIIVFSHAEGCSSGSILFLLYEQPNGYFNPNIRTFLAVEGKSEYMRLLINLDLIPDEEKESTIVFEDGIMRIFYNFMRLVDVSFHDGFPKLTEIVKLAEKVFFHDSYLGCFKRMYLAMLAIQAAQLQLKEDENKVKGCIDCLKMYFITTRDPLLTINEVRSMLYVCLHLLDKLHLFAPIYEEFVKLMPECSANFQPRNLIDLARCQFRENLQKCNLPLPAAIEKFSFPQLLKSFALGDVIDMSRKSGNISPETIITRSQLAELVFKS